MPFTVMKNIKLNLLRPELTVVHGKQYDNSSRLIAVQLFEDNTKWYAPENTLGVISYIKPDGNYGFYDETDLDETAVVFDEDDRSKATLILSTQVLTCAGKVKVEVNFYDQQQARRLSSFAFTLDVEKSTITQEDLTSSSEFRILAEQITQVLTAAANLTGLTAGASSLLPSQSPTVTVTGGSEGVPYHFEFGIPQGVQGERGYTGDSGIHVGTTAPTDPVKNVWINPEGTAGKIIDSYTYTGNHAAGSFDTLTFTFTDGDSLVISIYNGANGEGAVSTVAGIQPINADVPIVVIDDAAPTTSTVGYVNQIRFSRTNGIAYICTAISGNTYTWKAFGEAATAAPQMDGTANVGSSLKYAREDHVHPSDTSRQAANLYFTNKTVSSWASDNTYADFPYKGTISCNGVDSSMVANIIFAPAQAMSGDFAPVTGVGTNEVYIYATAQPADSFQIPTIIVMK